MIPAESLTNGSHRCADDELHAKLDLVLIDLASVKNKLDTIDARVAANEAKDAKQDAELEKVANTPVQLLLVAVQHPLFKDVVRVLVTAVLAAAAAKGIQ